MEELLNYGYRAAWKVWAGGTSFAVKADIRPGFQENEFTAHRNAGRAGVPVPEIVGFAGTPLPTLVLRWVDGVALHETASGTSWRHAGALLARAHLAPVLRPLTGTWSEFLFAWFARELPYVVEHCGLGQTEAAAALGRAAELRPVLDAGPAAWLHGDCQSAHFVVDPQSDDVVALIDWADAQPGDPVMDLAVLAMSHGHVDEILEGYGADSDFSERARLLVPLYQSVRAAGAARWLDAHGYPRVDWPVDLMRRFARGG